MKLDLHASEASRGAILALGFAVAITAGAASATVSDMDTQTRNFSFGEVASIAIQLEDSAWQDNKAINIMPGDEIPMRPVIKADDANTPAYYFISVDIPIVDGKEIFSINEERVASITQVPSNENEAMSRAKWLEVNVQSGTVGIEPWLYTSRTHVYACAYSWDGEGKLATKLPNDLGLMSSLTYDPTAKAKIDDQQVEVRAYALQADGLDNSIENVGNLWNLAQQLEPSREVYAL